MTKMLFVLCCVEISMSDNHDNVDKKLWQESKYLQKFVLVCRCLDVSVVINITNV